MNDENQLRKHYLSLGYEDVGDVNLSRTAYMKTQHSKESQWHQIGRCLYLVAYHDLKLIGIVDTSD